MRTSGKIEKKSTKNAQKCEPHPPPCFRPILDLNLGLIVDQDASKFGSKFALKPFGTLFKNEILRKRLGDPCKQKTTWIHPWWNT